MPRIPDEILNCSVYLYSNEREANQGTRSGGSGFLVVVEPDAEGELRPPPVLPTQLILPDSITGRVDPYPCRFFGYAVTNKHVIDKGFTVLRLNAAGMEGVRVIEIADSGWHRHPTSDLAIAYLPELDESVHRFNGVPVDMILNEENLRILDVGIGDDTFLVGRFVNHEGRTENRPTVRFGNLAMRESERDPVSVDDPVGPQVAMLIETRTIGGYSGSPVFLRIPSWEIELGSEPNSSRRDLRDNFRMLVPGEPPPTVTLLLGTLGGWLRGRRGKVYTGKKEIPGQRTEAEPTGMAWCIPSWKVLELLNLPKLECLREERRRYWDEYPPAGVSG